MKIALTCCKCGKSEEFEMATAGEARVHGWDDIGGLIRGFGWLLRANGDNLDIYCSEACSE